MKFSPYLLSLFILFSTQLHSQNAKLTGKVTEETGEGLISASVVIDASKGWAAVTDLNGSYEISVPAGTYDVSFHYIGKEEYKQNITLQAGENRILNVILREKQRMIDEVVVSGSKYEKKLSEETVSMDVVKGSALTDQNITSLDQGMTRVPGVTIADGQVNIRGGAGWSYGAGSRVQVLIDDLPLLTADAADAKWDVVPMENVDQVEIIKGAASALYGTSALNGIVNVRTAYPTDEPYFKVSLYSGVDEAPTISPDMKWWGKVPPLLGGTSFAYREKFGQSDLVIGGAFDGSTGYLDSSTVHSVRGNVKYRYRFKKIQGLNIGVNASAYYSWGEDFFLWNGIDSNGYKPYPRSISIYKSYRFSIDPFVDYFDKHNDQFKFIGRFFNATNTNNTGQGSVPNTYYAEFQYIRKFEFKAFDFHLVGGLVNVYDDVNPPADATNSLFGKNNEENFSAYAQTDFKFFKKLNVSLGARWEYFNQNHYVKDSTSPGHYYQRLDTTQNSLKELPYPLFRLGLNYQVAEATYIRASFGQGFRYPSIAERYISTSVGAITVASNPNLTPEKGYSAEVGIKQGIKLGKWMGYADVSGFLNEYQNMMEFTFGQFGNPAQSFGMGFSSQNIGRTRILGSELVLAAQGNAGPVAIQLLAGYTYLDPRVLDWNNTLNLYNDLGQKLTNTGVAAAAYNQNNNPQHTTDITYAMTSSSADNILKYTSRHLFKADVTLNWKALEYNTNVQFNSYQQNIDYAFISPLLQAFEGTAFSGLAQYRAMKENIPIGKGRGDIVWNMYLAYNFKAGIRVAVVVKNLLNWEYTPRPAYFSEPRNYTLQLSYTFKGKSKKEAK